MSEEKKTNVENEKIVKRKLNASPITLVLFIILVAALVFVLIDSLIRINSANKVAKNTSMFKENIYTDDNCNSSKSTIEPELCWKPVIYIYPTETTKLSVKLGKPENLTCSYPEYKDGWEVEAYPDGTLIDLNTGRKLYSLYWEGLRNKEVTFDEGFIVEGKDTIKFLEEKLDILGLNEKEAEEFIIYWLPKLQGNKYNLIKFATMEEIDNNMPLKLSSKPDTLIRVLMEYKAINEFTVIKEQQLVKAERTGFTVVEWGRNRS